jgi:hypothetical protein
MVGRATTRNKEEFEDIEDLTYVMVHLMCHAARTEIGHGDDFLELFTFLAKRAIDAGALGVFSEYLGIRGIREHACEVESAFMDARRMDGRRSARPEEGILKGSVPSMFLTIEVNSV